MHLAIVRRVCLVLLLLLLGGWPALLPAAPSDAAPRVLLHLNAQPSLQEEALGLSMALAARMDAGQAVNAISHFETLKSAQKAKLLGKGNQILARDLAFLALSTQAQKAVMGYLERRDSGRVLRLSSYSPEKGAPLFSVTLNETQAGADDLIARAQDALAPMLGLPKDYAWPKNESTLDWAQLKLAGPGHERLDQRRRRERLGAGRHGQNPRYRRRRAGAPSSEARDDS